MGRWLGNMSITTRTAIMLSALVGAIFVIAGLFSFFDADRRALATGLSTLDHYAQQVARQQEERFGRIRETHARATELLRAELATNSRLENPAAFDAMFAVDPRGGRRSAPALYDGGTTPLGYMRGVGAFIPQEPDAEKRKLLMAAAGVVHGLGEGVRPAMESLYLFTPQNELVMFAADRKGSARLLSQNRAQHAGLPERGVRDHLGAREQPGPRHALHLAAPHHLRPQWRHPGPPAA
ncbi:hypothetical protein [Sphingomonas sp. J315]|uniref:hypothetical protein n=1 Tax=Sphingomonas sp. J315 TaxID=2898433 RepID=UPI0021AE1509|nr:hypothetical protein [Sphingomonas sp. J315]UUX98532.1 hypothetical protein LRS08_13340 [Sphingomonas sp. J315]